MVCYCVWLLLISCLDIFVEGNTRPHIIFIVADDLGWNDVGFHGSNQVPTPNIDALAYAGVILNNYYVMPLCTPSRAALMTGRHPIHTGMQQYVLVASEPWGLSLSERLLPQYLQDAGYVTRAVGKWHLGHYKRVYTPIFRGFDSHFGYWSGHQDYYDHTAEESAHLWGHDMRRDMNVSRSESFGRYSTKLFTEEAVSLVRAHDTSRPLFLYLAHLAVHAGNSYERLQAPADVVKRFEHIKDPKRRIYAAMLSLLDESIGDVMSALGERGMLDNSIVVFTTDNGGAAAGYDGSAASNWPLRGIKNSLWEGGVRGAACVWSPLLSSAPRVTSQLMHMQDWLPTLMAAINTSEELVSGSQHLDGKSIWNAINDPRQPTYDELLLQIEDSRSIAALRSGKWKIIKGQHWKGEWDHVFGPSGREDTYDMSQVLESPTARTLENTSRPLPDVDTLWRLRGDATVECKAANLSTSCLAEPNKTCLFDVTSDPCETSDLASTHPDVLSSLLLRLASYNSSAVPPRNKPEDPNSDPKYWDYTWTNWFDYPPLHVAPQEEFDLYSVLSTND